MAGHRNVRRFEVRTAATHGRVVHESFSAESCWSPPVNVYERPDAVVVCVDLAGVDKQAVDVRVRPGRLSISGHRPAPEPRGDAPADTPDPSPVRIRLMEIDYGRFERDLPIPESVDLAAVTSAYADGILTVTLPRRVRG
ncbi:MAG: Hsp20/alpha crystallin family protein [Planctomycetota bacterium]